MNLTFSEKINIVRAGIMGANDGIISIAGVVIGMAGAHASNLAILIAGLAATVAGVFAMASGEFVSVHTQHDVELKEKNAAQNYAKTNPATLQKQISNSYQERYAINTILADKIVSEISLDKLSDEFLLSVKSVDQDNLTNPIHAAIASMLAFPVGAAFPIAGMTLLSSHYRLVATIILVIIALFITGYLPARLDNQSVLRPVLRNISAGLITMSVTFIIGSILHV